MAPLHRFSQASYAPTVPVPSISAMAVEHPCIVKNVTKAVEMIGGPRAISQTLAQGTDRTLALSFNPQEPTSRTVLSHHLPANNVLLRVQVPRRTGRKRKRGSSEPFLEDPAILSHRKDASYLLKSLSDNENSYSVDALAAIDSTHIWRSMPDYVYSTQASTFLEDIKDKILPQQLLQIKEWSLPRTYGLEDTEAFPPPVWSLTTIPQNYMYRQNPAVKTGIDPSTGKQVFQTQGAAPKIYTYQLQWDVAEIPTEPMPDCPPLESESESFRNLVVQLRQLFEERPIWTRRALSNMLPEDAPFFLIRFAVAHVAYALRSGPWRDAYIKLGIDPRTDPKYRKYQTLLFQLMPKDSRKEGAREAYQRSWTRSRDTESHIFTGTKPVPPDGKVWQICDLEDAQLKSLANTPEINLRPICEPRYFGWYANGTTAKMRVALKAKIDALALGEPLPDAALESFLALPDALNFGGHSTSNASKSDPTAGYLANKKPSRREMEWAAVYRSLARTETGELPSYGGMGKGRVSKAKSSHRPSYLGKKPADSSEQLEGSTRSSISHEDTASIERRSEPGMEALQEGQISTQYAEPEINSDSDGNEEIEVDG